MREITKSVIVFIIVVLFLLVVKPKFFFDGNTPKEFGNEKGQCICPYYTFALLFGVSGYLLCLFK